MSVHVFWPPLAILAMGVMMVAIIILKYGDKICLARVVAKPQNYELEDQCSENTTYMIDERGSMEERMSLQEKVSMQEMEVDDYPEDIMPVREKYEYAV